MLVFRTQLAVTHIHDLAFEWCVYSVQLIFYCSKRHMALKGLTMALFPVVNLQCIVALLIMSLRSALEKTLAQRGMFYNCTTFIISATH